MRSGTNPVPSMRVAYEEGRDPREIAAEWIGDAVNGWDGSFKEGTQAAVNALIGVGFALLALVDETRGTAS